METENLKEKSVSRNGGKRPGAGRKKGGKNKATLEKKIIENKMVQRILRSASSLINSQMNLAAGCQYLYVVRTVKNGKGKGQKLKPELVTSQPTIEAYLAGELEGQPDEYYYLTTDKPDNKALESLFERALGKVPNRIEGTGDDGAILLELKGDNYARVASREAERIHKAKS